MTQQDALRMALDFNKIRCAVMMECDSSQPTAAYIDAAIRATIDAYGSALAEQDDITEYDPADHDYSTPLKFMSEQDDEAVADLRYFSIDEGESWYDFPDDPDMLQSIDGLKVGDEYEVTASYKSITQTYKVVNIDWDQSLIEAELVSQKGPVLFSRPAPKTYTESDIDVAIGAVDWANTSWQQAAVEAKKLIMRFVGSVVQMEPKPLTYEELRLTYAECISNRTGQDLEIQYGNALMDKMTGGGE